MALPKLTDFDRGIIFECLRAVAHGPFIDDCEFRILFGLSRAEVLEIASRVPNIDDDERNVRLAIGGALINLTGYPHGKEAEWSAWISASADQVTEVLARWFKSLPSIEFASLQVFGPVMIDSKFYRVITYTVKDGGCGQCSEIWEVGGWSLNQSGPGCKQIIATPLADPLTLCKAGVDQSPLPRDYDPIRTGRRVNG